MLNVILQEELLESDEFSVSIGQVGVSACTTMKFPSSDDAIMFFLAVSKSFTCCQVNLMKNQKLLAGFVKN